MNALPINQQDLHPDNEDDDDDDDASLNNFDCMIRQITSSRKEHGGTTRWLIMSPWRPMDGAETLQRQEIRTVSSRIFRDIAEY